MDWTSVFEEDGDEAFLISQQLTAIPRAPRLGRLVSKLYHQYDSFDSCDGETIDSDGGHDKVQQHTATTIQLMEEDISEHRLFQLATSSSDMDLKPSTSAAASDKEAVSSSSGYTLRALYYLSINYILGVGCLGIPYAFARAGFALCIGILLIVTLSSYMTVMWVAETGERYQQQQQQLATTTAAQGRTRQHSGASETSPLVPHNSHDQHQPHHHHHHQQWDRYEVVDLIGFYLGPLHKILYQIALMALMYIGLLAYSQVFCSAISELLFHNSNNTNASVLPQLLFGVMVIPLSCVELDEQISIQSLMAAVRFLAIFIMVFGSLLALFLDDSNASDNKDDNWDVSHPPYWAPPERDNCQMSYTACVSGFGVAFSTSLFSQLFQHSVPGLLRPLRDQPSKHSKVPKTFGASLLTTLSFYLLLGTSAASFFGAKTRSSVNLNFANFTMGLDPQIAPFWLLSVVRTASSIVVVFPALDTISVFPLIANTLGNNLSAAAVGPATIRWFAHWIHRQQRLYQRLVLQMRQSMPGTRRQQSNNGVLLSRSNSLSHLSQEERKHLIEQASKLITIFWRLVAALPPLLGSIVAADLSFSFLLAGLAGVYVAFFAPSLMQLKSVSESTNHGGPFTIFQGWYSSTFLCYPVLAFAAFSLGAVLFQIKGAWLDMRK